MSKIVYIIPGFHGSVNMPRYRRIIKQFKIRGFKTVPIKITWNRKVMSDYINEFINQLQHDEHDRVYIFGFSLGAFIAFAVASKIGPEVLILGSLSPFFKEDLQFIKKSWKKYLGKNRLADFSNFSFNKLSKRNKKYKTYLLVGAMEDKTLLQKAQSAYNNLAKAKIIIIKNSRHSIKNENYYKGIIGVIDEVNK